MRASFRNFNFILALHSYFRDKKIEHGFLQITCFKECKNMTVKENPSVTINFYQKQCLPVIIWNKKHLSMKLYKKHKHWRKTFLQFANPFFSERVKKLAVYLVCISLFWICSEDKAK